MTAAFNNGDIRPPIATKLLTVIFTVSMISIGMAENVDAAWLFAGNTQNGAPTYLDTNSGLTWTRTLGRVPSSQNGVTARQHLQQIGFRLPSFQELQAMHNFNNGGQILGINTGLFDYYETNNTSILGNAFGNGFQTPQKRKGVGHNWYIGVR